MTGNSSDVRGVGSTRPAHRDLRLFIDASTLAAIAMAALLSATATVRPTPRFVFAAIVAVALVPAMVSARSKLARLEVARAAAMTSYALLGAALLGGYLLPFSQTSFVLMVVLTTTVGLPHLESKQLIRLSAASLAAIVAIPVCATVAPPMVELSDTSGRWLAVVSTTTVGSLVMLRLWQQTTGLVAAYSGERHARTRAERLFRQARRLERLTSKLSSRVELQEAAGLILHEALEAVGGTCCGVWTLDEGSTVLRMVRQVGFPEAIAAHFQAVPLSGDSPLATSVRTGEAVFTDTRERYSEQHAASFARVEALGFQGEFASACVPLRMEQRCAGALVVGFSHPRSLAPDERAFLVLLSRHAAQALERASMFSREREAARRLEFLASASVQLSQSLDRASTFERVVGLAVPAFADWAFVDLLTGDTIERVALAHSDPAHAPLADRLRTEYSPEFGHLKGVSSTITSGRVRWLHEVTERELQCLARSPGHMQLLRDMGMRSVISVPLSVRGTIIGSLTFVSCGRLYGDSDRWLVEELGARAALAIDNARLFTEATHAVRARDEFLSIASHELRTPLTALLLQLESVARRFERNDAAESKGLIASKLERAVDNVRRVNDLIATLLDLSRITSGRLHLDPEPVDLEDLATDVVERFSEQAALVGSSLTLRVQARMTGAWDRLRVEQVVTNLIENAIKYGAGGPITVTLSQRADTPHAGPTEGRDDALGPCAVIEVEDHGIGIAEAAAERIFLRFERAVSERNYGGFGLGLFITRQIVEAQGGTISFESTENVGTVFRVTLPFAPLGMRTKDVAPSDGPPRKRFASSEEGAVALRART